MVTHCEVEAQVSVGRGVQEGSANSPPALLLKDQRQSRLNLSALRPKHSAIYVPAKKKKAKGVLFFQSLCQNSSLNTTYTMSIPLYEV